MRWTYVITLCPQCLGSAQSTCRDSVALVLEAAMCQKPGPRHSKGEPLLQAELAVRAALPGEPCFPGLREPAGTLSKGTGLGGW